MFTQSLSSSSPFVRSSATLKLQKVIHWNTAFLLLLLYPVLKSKGMVGDDQLVMIRYIYEVLCGTEFWVCNWTTCTKLLIWEMLHFLYSNLVYERKKNCRHVPIACWKSPALFMLWSEFFLHDEINNEEHFIENILCYQDFAQSNMASHFNWIANDKVNKKRLKWNSTLQFRKKNGII